MTPREYAGECVVELLTEHDPKLLETIRVVWSKRMTSTAGYAYYRKPVIKLSIPLLCNVPFGEVRQMVGHELAHKVSVRRYGLQRGRGHGAKWKRTMRDMGLRVERTHGYRKYPAVQKALGLAGATCARCGTVHAGTPRQITKWKTRGAVCRCGGALVYV